MTKMGIGIVVASSLLLASCGESPTAPSAYTCLSRAGQIRSLLTQVEQGKAVIPTMFDTREGERVYLDWLGRASHVSGPLCVGPSEPR